MNLLFRFFYNILKNLIFDRPISIDQSSIVKLRVLPTDLDLNFHMNNGRYLTLMDIGRTDLVVRVGLSKIILKEKLSAVAAGININFFKPLNPFDSYELHTSVITWDESWFYLRQNFIKDKKIMASAVAKTCFLKNGKRMDPAILVEMLGEHKNQPPMPKYLSELIQGDKHLIEEVKLFNKS